MHRLQSITIYIPDTSEYEIKMPLFSGEFHVVEMASFFYVVVFSSLLHKDGGINMSCLSRILCFNIRIRKKTD